LVDTSAGLWHLRGPGGALNSFAYGNPGDLPFTGDWDCDGIDTPGLYRQADGFVYLRNSNSQGVADIRFFFGNPGDLPLAGDFDGDGCDTVSIYRASSATFYIVNELGANDGGLGAADYSYIFGNPGDKPFVGDFNGDGIETAGLHRESTGFVYFRQSNSQGAADAEFFFGDPADRLIAGDWGVVDGTETVAVFRPSVATFFFRFTNSQGVADESLQFGESHHLPVAGVWGTLAPPSPGAGSVDVGAPTSPENSLAGESGDVTDGPPPGTGGGDIPAGGVANLADPNGAPDIFNSSISVEASLPQFPLPSSDPFLPQEIRNAQVLQANSDWVSASNLPGPIGLLLSYRDGVLQESCSATLVQRRFVITAAHCLVDRFFIKYNGFRFYPKHYPGVARESYVADAFFMWPSYQTWQLESKIFLDYGLVRLTQTNGSWPGDRYGWYGLWMYGPASDNAVPGQNYPWDETRSVVGYPVEGLWGQWSTNAVPSVYPWVCSTGDGIWFHRGNGWWLIASGCLHSGGMSGGPVFAFRSGQWRVIGVNSSGQHAVECGPSNWPVSYPCPNPNSRFSALRNSWTAPLLSTPGVNNDFDTLWNEAFAWPG
jgi:V8-like Glu-specific endopeptidase